MSQWFAALDSFSESLISTSADFLLVLANLLLFLPGDPEEPVEADGPFNTYTGTLGVLHRVTLFHSVAYVL